MQLLTADYVLIGLAVVLTLLGGYRGLSGTIAFFVAIAISVMTARFFWPCVSANTLPIAAKLVVAAVVTLVVFAIVRILVAKCVKFMLSRPTDVILGAATGIIAFLLVVFLWTYIGNRVHADCPSIRNCSNIIRSVSSYVG